MLIMSNQFSTKEGKQKYLEKRTGQRFGKLVALKRVGTDKNNNTLWKCKCDCGNTPIVSMGALTRGHTKSCGCLSKEKLIDIRGKKFGKWLVLNEPYIPTEKGASWKCKCDCGTIKQVNSNDLRKGISTSCGCSTKLPEGESACRWLFNHYKKDNAKKRGFSWEFTLDDFKKITKERCWRCGEEPKQIMNMKDSHRNGAYIYNGIDRKDNTQGYTKENSVACCGYCNSIKSDKSEEEYIEHINKMVEVHNSRNEKKVRPTDIDPSYSYNEGDEAKNERINFRHWNDLLYEKDNGEKDTTYSSLWLYRNAKEIPPFKDTIGSKSKTQAIKEGKEYFSEFNPLVAENIINFWSDEKDNVLDVFAGRTRGIVAGLKHRKYYGFEISPIVHKAVLEVIEQGKERFDEGYKPEIYCDNSVNLLNYNLPEIDLIFTCPPYHNLEKYESVEGQLSDIEDYGKFLEALKEIMKVSLSKLKENGFACLVVGDFRREDRLVPFDCDVTKMIEELGVVLWDKVILQNINFGWAGIKFGNIKHKRQTSKVTEYLLVFKKIKKEKN